MFESAPRGSTTKEAPQPIGCSASFCREPRGMPLAWYPAKGCPNPDLNG